MGQIQNFEDLLNFLMRRRWLILAVALAGAIAAAVMAKSRTDVFEASAAIQVQGAQVGGVGGETGASRGSAQMLQSIEQRLTSREAMLALIERQGLYSDLVALSPEQKVALLRASIRIEGIEAVSQNFGQPAQLSAILVSARDGNAEKAARIANDLAQSLLDQSSTATLDRARDTLGFYREEEARLSTEILAKEAAIADYKNSHAEALSAVADARRDEMVGLEAELRRLDQDLLAERGRARQLTGQGGQLRATERRQLQEIEARIAVMEEQKTAMESRRDELRASFAGQPEVERVLSGLERELTQLQTTLQGVSMRVADSETTLRLTERQQGERFSMLDRAITPQYSVGSGGKKLFLAGAMASLLGGIGLAFLLDLMRPVVRTSRQMERQLGLRPVIAIPELDLPAPKARRRDAAGPGKGDGDAGHRRPAAGGSKRDLLPRLNDAMQVLPRPVAASLGLTVVLMMTAAVFA